MSYLGQLQSFLSGLVTTEARVAATVVLTLAAVVTAIVLAPRAVSAAHRTLKYLVFNHERVPVDPPEFDWQLPVTALVRTFQLSVFIAAGLAVLVVWGFVDLALAAVTVMASWIPVLGRGLLTVGLVGATLAGIDMLDTAIEQYAEESDQLNQHQQGIVFRVLQVAVLLAAGIVALSVWGVGLGNLLVGAGFLGIVVGTAARSTIGSFIAGFVLMFARPFEIGDWVEINDDEGIITDITIINTRMRNAAGEEVVIPNDNVANATITNRTSLERLRLSVDVGVDYDTDVERAEAITGQPAPRAVSPTLFSVLSSVMGLVDRVAEPPEGMEPETLAFLSDNTVRVDSSKARRELGVEHRPIDEGLGQYLEWEQAQRGVES